MCFAYFVGNSYNMKHIKGIIVDIDGVLEFQGKVYPGAIETIQTLREQGKILRFLTNSTLKSRLSCAQKLQSRGFRVSPEEVITASYATAQYLRACHPRSCWVMAEREGMHEFQEFQHDSEQPEYVVIGDNRSRFDFTHLNLALRFLLKGAKLIGMQGELLDNSMGEPELNVGSWVSMLERASGVQATYIGKPNAYVFELALKTMELQKSEVVMVGDRLETDIVGAREFGLSSILMKTGEFTEQDLESHIQADVVCHSIRDVLDVLT